MIVIRDLAKRFGSLRVLDGIDLTIETGDCHVILGRSGTGKSVLLKHIIGLMRPDRGNVTVDGLDVATADYEDLAALRMRFGMLFQMAALFDSMTVGENVGLALREHRKQMKETEVRRIVAEKLALVGLEGSEEKKPSELSGGMRKRVGLARAIAMGPEYILFDEPTTGLDPVTADQIDRLIVDLQKELRVTSVVVTHDLRSAFHVADRLCLLHEGKVIFNGTPDEIRESPDPLVRQFIRGDADGPLTNHGGPAPAKGGAQTLLPAATKEGPWRPNARNSR
jgi:phospholipid/cholesterol/gamma-HCH transport system ATP-binding protein